MTRFEESGKKKRGGFASMNQEKQRELARRGGLAAHQKGTAHEFTRDEARAAGRKGGVAVSKDRDHMSRIGRAGGLSATVGPRRVNTPERSTPGVLDTLGEREKDPE